MGKHHHRPKTRAIVWFSVLGNFLLFLLKLWAGMVSSSVTLIADAWHTLSDSLSSVIVFFAIRLSRKPPDEEHPFGHGRSDVIASVFVGSMLAFIAFHFLLESISRLTLHESAEYGAVAIWVTVGSILIKEVMARLSIWAGEKGRVQSLIADGWHHRSDALSSVIVLVGIWLSDDFWWIDGLMGVLISFFIAWVAYGIIKDSVNALLGQSPDPKMLPAIQKMCNNKAEREVHAHHLQMHDYGDHKEVVFHIRLPESWSLQKVHDLVDIMEAEIEEKMEVKCTIHVDPLKINLE